MSARLFSARGVSSLWPIEVSNHWCPRLSLRRALTAALSIALLASCATHRAPPNLQWQRGPGCSTIGQSPQAAASLAERFGIALTDLGFVPFVRTDADAIRVRTNAAPPRQGGLSDASPFLLSAYAYVAADSQGSSYRLAVSSAERMGGILSGSDSIAASAAVLGICVEVSRAVDRP
jgi:hypothetical protein